MDDEAAGVLLLETRVVLSDQTVQLLAPLLSGTVTVLQTADGVETEQVEVTG